MDTLSTLSPAHRALRRGRHSIPSQVYLLTTLTQERRPLFLPFDVAAHACRVLAEPRLWRDTRLLCWVLMPDHFHAVVELGRSESLGELMRRVKAVSAMEINRVRAASTAVWGSGYHDHALRNEEDVIGVARYVIANPLRAGLARTIADYPYWDAVWVDGEPDTH
jgi:REP element-mobilizing transposase RayT